VRKRTTVQESEQGAAIFGEDPLAGALRTEIRGVIERVLAEELADALDAGPYARTQGRSGYRNGTEKRTLGTSLGTTTFEKPRGRIWKVDGGEEEFQSQMLPRYQRRCRQLDNEILAMYLGGVSTRKVKRIVRLLGGPQTLSSSGVSRVVSSLREHFESWQQRSLSEEPIVYLYLDAIAVKARMAKRVVSRPILVAVGVRESGQKVLLGACSPKLGPREISVLRSSDRQGRIDEAEAVQ
jgi:transposase-like protein